MTGSRTLYQSLFIKTAFVAVAPIIVIAALIYGLLIPDFHKRIDEENQALSRALQVQVELFLRAPQLVLNGISAEIQSLPNLTLADMRQILDSQIEKNQAFDSLYLVNNRNGIEAMGLPIQRRPYRRDYEGLTLTKSQFVGEARRRQSPYWSNTFLSVVSGKNSLALELPANDKVLVGEFSIEQLSRFIQQVKAEDSRMIIITDQLGQIVAHPEPEKASRQRNISNLSIVQAALAKRPLTEEFRLGGIDYIGASQPIPEMGWTVLAAQPLEVALGEMRAVRLILLTSLVGAALLALLMGRIIAGRLAAPFERFATAATEVSQGLYQRPLPSSSIIEVNTLTNSFRSMIEAIQEREASLEQSQQKYREVVEGTDDLITRVDPEGRFTYVNHSARQIFGLQPQSCIGRSAFDFIHPDDRQYTTRAFDQWIDRGLSTVTFENRQLSVDGEVHHILWSINIHRDGKGQVQEVSSIGHDITARILTEQENRRLHRYLQNIIESMPSAIIGLNRDGIVTQWNRIAEQFLGLNSKQAIGQPITQLGLEERLDPELISKAIETGLTQTRRRQRQAEEEGQLHEDISVFPLFDQQVEGVVIRIDNVTDQVRMEEMVIQSEKMLSVGGLAAGMAHEINNPLAGIMQNTQVIKNRLAPEIPKNQETARECGTDLEAIGDYMEQRGILGMLESVLESGRRAARIVENMLNFSRNSASQMVPHDLAVLFEKTLELATNDYDLKKRFDFRQIEIIKQFDSELPPVVCEAGKIQQVLLNLLKNAAQAMADNMEQQPRITLRLARVGNNARIEIEDNGPGMREAVRKRVFEPFFTTKSVGAGTGLGLSVSYFIVTENHKGSMSVESAPGSGACFVILLPIDGGLKR